MPAPPSRQSWVWQVAAVAAERAAQWGSLVEDMRIEVTSIRGAFRVRVSDVNFGGQRNPDILAQAVLPVDGTADRLRADIRTAIATELHRLTQPVPPPPHWREQVAAELAVWAGRLGIDADDLMLRLDAEEGRIILCADEGSEATPVKFEVPRGVTSLDLAALVRMARTEAQALLTATRH